MPFLFIKFFETDGAQERAVLKLGHLVSRPELPTVVAGHHLRFIKFV